MMRVFERDPQKLPRIVITLGIDESVREGGPGSGNWAHTSISRKGKGKGGSDAGGGTAAYFAGLDEEFGEWKPGAGQEIAEGIMDASEGRIVRDWLINHLGGADKFDKESMEKVKARAIAQGTDVKSVSQTYRTVTRAAQWELYHRLGEKTEMTLYHGSKTGSFGRNPRTYPGASFSDSARQAAGFTNREVGAVYRVRVPITQVNMWYGGSKLSSSGPLAGEREFIVKAGARPSILETWHREFTGALEFVNSFPADSPPLVPIS